MEAREGWKILNAQPGPGVDYVGTCDDLSQFADGSIDEVYASHVFEHLGYFEELPRTLFEVSRVMRVGGTLMVGVPDLAMLSRMLTHPSVPLDAQFALIRMIYGGQVDAYDFHKVGFTEQVLFSILSSYCFGNFQRVQSFGLFQDCTEIKVFGHPISLNVRAIRGTGAPPAVPPWGLPS